ncbi:triose-phosphate isomerase [Pseudodesulfovibrio piezophilus]|uniref:Triosephosphate isomerase n=1 Tax=Pseudodesulfovibrio piezophilus (strain DSM 21447 / JCM 15486 / C1TLV30) TaxID=1322246 RepID=M1WJD1_PSEP2|nr:triose-phosphate isomerase [Pseudodesulfovibrio piezophilus]CCH47686.1 Triosephosphate isomerase [Pseudodesulfovibrio piezophilus C1TLV30]
MKKLMAANWKMFKTWDEAQTTAREIVEMAGAVLPEDRELLVLPPFTSLRGVSKQFKSIKGFSTGGQNFYCEEEGAFTGEISPRMLTDAGAAYGLTGHSERRHIMGESDTLIGRKTAYGVQSGLKIILCVGETDDEREKNQIEVVLKRQLDLGLEKISRKISPENISIAYEPVWAIGTGKVAGEAEIVAAHTFIRKTLISIFGNNGNKIRVLYGGSVKSSNCGKIIALDNVDGVLVGGASLHGESFSEIVLAKRCESN